MQNFCSLDSSKALLMVFFSTQAWGDTSTQCPLPQYTLPSRSGRPNSQNVAVMAVIFPSHFVRSLKAARCFGGTLDGSHQFVRSRASTKGQSCQAALAPPVWLLVCWALMGWWSGAKASGKRDGSCPLTQLGSYRGRQRWSPHHLQGWYNLHYIAIVWSTEPALCTVTFGGYTDLGCSEVFQEAQFLEACAAKYAWALLFHRNK